MKFYTLHQHFAHKSHTQFFEHACMLCVLRVCMYMNVCAYFHVHVRVLSILTGVKWPYSVGVSKSGEIVVSEYEHRVSIFSRQGEKMQSFGSLGQEQGQFQYPRGIVLTSDNHILVADSENHRIQKFTLKGRFVTSVGDKGNGLLQFNHPSGIAVHPSGRIFVADQNNDRIQVLYPDLKGSYLFGSEGNTPGEFRHPLGVACDNSGLVYVTDSDNHRIQVFSADGQFKLAFGREGFQDGQLIRPTGICIDATNTVYITDLNDRVSVFSHDGKFIKCFTTTVSLDRERRVSLSNYAGGLAINNATGALYVCDRQKNRVIVY